MSTITADQTTIVPRNPRESYTITNPHPFPVTFTRDGVETSIPANSTGDDAVTITNVAGEGVSWTISTPTTTEYQFTITNNSPRSLISGTLTHGSSTVDLAGLEPGQFRTSDISATTGASATFMQEIPQSGAMTVVTPANLNLINSGIGTTPTDPNDLEAVRYNFAVNFTDSTTDINVDYQTPENRTPGASGNLTNTGAVTGFVAALNADTQFTTYFRTITTAQDSEIPTDRFRIEALAAPGNAIPGTSLTMPPHDGSCTYYSC